MASLIDHLIRRAADMEVELPMNLVPPAWITANILICIIFLVLTWTIVLLRCFTRIRFSRLGVDDYMLLVTMVHCLKIMNFMLGFNSTLLVYLLYSHRWCSKSQFRYLWQNKHH
jgi:hypothetical protein